MDEQEIKHMIHERFEQQILDELRRAEGTKSRGSRGEEVVSAVVNSIAHDGRFQSFLLDLTESHGKKRGASPGAAAGTLVWTFDSDDGSMGKEGLEGDDGLSYSGSRSTVEEINVEERSRMMEDFGVDSELASICTQLAPTSTEGTQRESLEALMNMPPEEVLADANIKSLFQLLSGVFLNRNLSRETNRVFCSLFAASVGGFHSADLICAWMRGMLGHMSSVNVCVCQAQEKHLMDQIESFSLLSSFFDGIASAWNTLSEEQMNEIFECLCSLYNLQMNTCEKCLQGVHSPSNQCFPSMFLFVLADSSLSWMEVLFSRSSARHAFLVQALKASVLSKVADFLSSAGELVELEEEQEKEGILSSYDLFVFTTYHNVNMLALLTRYQETCCMFNNEEARADWIQLHDSNAELPRVENLRPFACDACKLFGCLLTSRSQTASLVNVRQDLLRGLGEVVGSSIRSFCGMEREGRSASAESIATRFIQVTLRVCKMLRDLLESIDTTRPSKRTCEQVLWIAEVCMRVVENAEKDFPDLLFYARLNGEREEGDGDKQLIEWMRAKLSKSTWYAGLAGSKSFGEMSEEMNTLSQVVAERVFEISPTEQSERLFSVLTFFLSPGRSRLHLYASTKFKHWTKQAKLEFQNSCCRDFPGQNLRSYRYLRQVEKSLQGNGWEDLLDRARLECISDLFTRMENRADFLAADSHTTDINTSWNLVMDLASPQHNANDCALLWDKLLAAVVNYLEDIDSKGNDSIRLSFMWAFKRLCWLTASPLVHRVCKDSKLLKQWIEINIDVDGESKEEHPLLRRNPEQETLLLILLRFISHNISLWIEILTEIPNLRLYVLGRYRVEAAGDKLAPARGHEPKDFVHELQQAFDPMYGEDMTQASGSLVIDREALLCDDIITSGTFFSIGLAGSIEEGQQDVLRLPATLRCIIEKEGKVISSKAAQMKPPYDLDSLIHFPTQDGFIQACHGFLASIPAAAMGTSSLSSSGAEESEEWALKHGEMTSSLFWTLALKACSDSLCHVEKAQEDFQGELRYLLTGQVGRGQTCAIFTSLLYVLNECCIDDAMKSMSCALSRLCLGLSLSPAAGCDRLSKFAELVAEEELKDVARGYRELGVSIGMVASCWISQAFLNTFEWQEVFVWLLLPAAKTLALALVEGAELLSYTCVVAVKVMEAHTRRHYCDDEYEFLELGKQSLPDFRLSQWIAEIRGLAERYEPLCKSFLYKQ
ncbi:hypothetical protein GUITHDRAFT_143502 [Guillardia theta CCMP2712]|uniref:Uncharacterized protein n=1 Tax=Guillardia theta (strain CCMP2712) TaxID=905079 RepID=L1IUE1_GUITC|nr:hypothetical protein GUITHDRAFT_143502 [Guillardia theta CCMP2712]EKX39519.1 hypothetical protein GUITHDRAFT_143502 [Guillardia theta CCMP2712]|eukprot:XP_005826499.1 hypothetical protein GUITHDRAFT_143502 [Guillardia theta CCMP2712]